MLLWFTLLSFGMTITIPERHFNFSGILYTIPEYVSNRHVGRLHACPRYTADREFDLYDPRYVNGLIGILISLIILGCVGLLLLGVLLFRGPCCPKCCCKFCKNQNVCTKKNRAILLVLSVIGFCGLWAGIIITLISLGKLFNVLNIATNILQFIVTSVFALGDAFSAFSVAIPKIENLNALEAIYPEVGTSDIYGSEWVAQTISTGISYTSQAFGEASLIMIQAANSWETVLTKFIDLFRQIHIAVTVFFVMNALVGLIGVGLALAALLRKSDEPKKMGTTAKGFQLFMIINLVLIYLVFVPLFAMEASTSIMIADFCEDPDSSFVSLFNQSIERDVAIHYTTCDLNFSQIEPIIEQTAPLIQNASDAIQVSINNIKTRMNFTTIRPLVEDAETVMQTALNTVDTANVEGYVQTAFDLIINASVVVNQTNNSNIIVGIQTVLQDINRTLVYAQNASGTSTTQTLKDDILSDIGQIGALLSNFSNEEDRLGKAFNATKPLLWNETEAIIEVLHNNSLCPIINSLLVRFLYSTLCERALDWLINMWIGVLLVLTFLPLCVLNIQQTFYNGRLKL